MVKRSKTVCVGNNLITQTTHKTTHSDKIVQALTCLLYSMHLSDSSTHTMIFTARLDRRESVNTCFERLPLLARFYVLHIWDSACFPKYVTCSSSHPFYAVLCLIYAWIKDWNTYQHLWSLVWYVALVPLWRGTQYIEGAECRKGYLQVGECIQCMNEYQGRNNGWAEMSKLMLNLGAQPNTHTHSWSSIQLNQT